MKEIVQPSVTIELRVYGIDWAQSDQLKNPPPANPDVTAFLNEVESFAKDILSHYGGYDQARDKRQGAGVPAEMNTAVALIDHLKKARKCIEVGDSTGAFF